MATSMKAVAPVAMMLCWFVASAALAEPTLDPSFGISGFVRVGVPSGREDTAVQSIIQADGKVAVLGITTSRQAAAFVTRFTTSGTADPTFGDFGTRLITGFDQSFGGPAGTPVPFTTITAMARTPSGHLIVAGQDPSGALVARYRLDTAVVSVPVVEYFNVTLRHYFDTASTAEMTSIENGGAGAGWQRTGNDFRAWVAETGVSVGAMPVCRFYGTPGRGPNSHFYTANSAECAKVKADAGWTYEGIAFFVMPPGDGSCADAVPVHRAYNNGFASNDSNHRYSNDLSRLTLMQQQGWTVEGLAFCGGTTQ